MIRSTPLREFTSSCTAISSAVPFLKNPPTPTYSPSVFSRKTMNRTSFVVRSRNGVNRSWNSSTGRAFTYRSSLKRKPSRMSAACWLEGTRGSPSAPNRIASKSFDNISTAPGGSVTPSRRNLSAPQSNSTKSICRPADDATALIALIASGVTSFPMPSPGITAIRAALPPSRIGFVFPFCEPAGTRLPSCGHSPHSYLAAASIADLFFHQEPVCAAAQDSSQNRRYPEQPQLLHCPAFHEYCRTRAARRIHRKVGHRYPHQVNQRQSQTDCNRSKARTRALVR